VNSQNLQSSSSVWDSDVNLPIESAEATQSCIDTVAICLVTLRSNGINLIDEDDCWRMLLSLGEGLAEVRFGLAGKLGHDFGTIDEEKEGAGLVGDSAGDQGLASTGLREED
jgi:hypothetical protein